MPELTEQAVSTARIPADRSRRLLFLAKPGTGEVARC